MTHILSADEGKWLYSEPLNAEEKRDFIKKVRTSEPELYFECTEEERIAYEIQWEEEHKVEEVVDETTQEAQGL